jgi:hypothetical protein
MSRFIQKTIIELEEAVTTETTSIPLGPDNITNLSFVISHGDIVGTVAFYVSNDRRADPNHPEYANARWHDITSEFTNFTQPAGSSGSLFVGFTLNSVGYIKMIYTHTSGDEYLYVDFHGQVLE